jgi:PleD family two-component response regulator
MVLRRAAAFKRSRKRADGTMSFGVATAPGDGTSTGELYRVADQALYEAERAGRNRVHASPAGERSFTPSRA